MAGQLDFWRAFGVRNASRCALLSVDAQRDLSVARRQLQLHAQLCRLRLQAAGVAQFGPLPAEVVEATKKPADDFHVRWLHDKA
ncbi:hypothetical protein M3I53_10245 [Paraburkholderia sp. CNPSo 3272]|uniref:hypothetical protein n=1 Tax=Paraburkholderia sp. CNPSo 3272 TaxID=2940931 RepID=UPI0020B85BA1|nr:hypothetical protein [Paraburkholderia sp. CNPSo 3272]MCP3723506.1 hypothetical protein [Paraburkholderia sp. CNPSo 3272]